MNGADRKDAGAPRSGGRRLAAARKMFLFHLRPVRLPRRAALWAHTFGLGGSALVLWGALAFTGILMLLVYQPVPDVAYDSVRTLDDDVRFGRLIRGVHYWSANLLVAVVVLHVARAFLTGGYHRRRRLNWWIGAALLAGVLASAFTGYLLPWDQRAYWAVTISTGMLAYVPLLGSALQEMVRRGLEVGPDTLLTFYTAHTTILPVAAVGLMAFHFWRVRKAGGVIVPPPEDGEPDEWIPFLPDLLVREASQALVILALVVLLGAWMGAPTGERANPGASPNPAKAPWFFMGFQELLIHLHPAFAVLILPVAAAVGFLALPFLGDEEGPVGRWFLSRPALRAGCIAAAAGIGTAVVAVLVDGTATRGASAGGWLLRGLLPTLIFSAIAATSTWAVRRHFGLGRNESVQSLILFLCASFATLTAFGVLFRGEGMVLTSPWGG